MKHTLFNFIVGLVAVIGCETGNSTPSVQTDSAAEHRIVVDKNGYVPASVPASAGEILTLEFVRTSDEGCGQEVVFPEHGIRRRLPLNETVSITLTPKSGESIMFTCGMGMYRGVVVASN
ncbi:MAG: cupredoxin domain-containing protein [Myxococcota bacterium]